MTDVPDKGGDVVFIITVAESGTFRAEEEYIIESAGSPAGASRIFLKGASPRAVLYAVFDFLERQGMFYGLHGETCPLNTPRSINLPPG